MRRIIYILLPFLFGGCQKPSETVRPELTNITESVYASVEVIPDDTYFAYAPQAGIIQDVLIEEGQTVDSGQVLLRVAAPTQSTRIEQARLSVAQARENFLGDHTLLDNIETQIERASKTLAVDSMQYYRQKHLWAQGIGSQTQLEKAQLAYELSQKQCTALQQEYAQTRIRLQNTYQQALEELQREQITARDYKVRGEMDGMVYSVSKEKGEYLSPQEAFAQLGSRDEFHLSMTIDEVDIVRIDSGDLALVQLDAYPGEVFEARLTRILPVKDDATQTFQVECRFEQKPPVLYYGLAGEASIVVSRKNEALTIPASFLLPGDKVMTDAGEIPVQTGLKNLEFVEILSGIDTTTVLQKPSSP